MKNGGGMKNSGWVGPVAVVSVPNSETTNLVSEIRGRLRAAPPEEIPAPRKVSDCSWISFREILAAHSRVDRTYREQAVRLRHEYKGLSENELKDNPLMREIYDTVVRVFTREGRYVDLDKPARRTIGGAAKQIEDLQLSARALRR
jgi:hypothetical protein